MSDIRITVHTREGQSHPVDAAEDVMAAELLQELIEGLHLATADANGRPVPWVLLNKDTRLILDPQKTLGGNGVQNGHSLYIEVQQPASEPGIKVHVHLPNGEAHLQEVSPDYSLGKLIAEFLPKLHPAGKAGSSDSTKWNVVNKDTGKSLDLEKSLQENGVRNGHHLYLHEVQRNYINYKRVMRPLLLGILLSAILIVLYISVSPSLKQLPAVIQTPSGEMILIPAGVFLSGKTKSTSELPAFYIDKTEVTNEAFKRFCQETRRPFPPGLKEAPANYPVVDITIQDAREFAKWAGKRLPNSREWEKATRGTDGRLYPWGNENLPDRANVGNHPDVLAKRRAASLMPVNSFPLGASVLGVQDMVGNAWELIDELRSPSPEAIRGFDNQSPVPNPNEPWYMIMGGSYRENLQPEFSYDFASVPRSFHSGRTGFRCVKDP